MNPHQDTAAGLATVDPAEAEYYHRLADTWWDRAGPFWPLHRYNAVRLDYLRDALPPLLGRTAAVEAPLAGLRVLDAGCGGGLLAEGLSRMGATVTGIDVVERNIAVARLHAEQSDAAIDYRCDGVETLAAAGETFDCVFALEVVEHVADLGLFLDSCAALVRPGGVLAVSTINRTLKSFVFAIVGAEYVMRWLPRGTHQWRRFVTPAELTTHLARNGIDPVEWRGVAVNPVTRAFSINRNLAVNYLALALKND